MKRIFLTLIICVGLLSSLTIGWSAEISDSGNFVRSSSPDVQKQVFENMFGLAYEPEHPNYSLAEQVEGPGVYTGWNQNGTQFELEVILHGDIELAQIGLPMPYLQEAVGADLRIGSAVARISSGGVEMAVTGLVVSANLPIDGFQSRFMVTSIEDPASALFNPADLTIDNSPELPAPDFSSRRGRGTAVGPAPMSECEKDCWEIYLKKLEKIAADGKIAKAKAWDDYKKREQREEATRQDAISAATQAYRTEMNRRASILLSNMMMIHADFVMAMAVCAGPVGWLAGLFTGGALTAACVITAHVAYAYLIRQAIMEDAEQRANILGRFVAAKKAANEAYNKIVDAARELFDGTIKGIDNEILIKSNKAKLEFDLCMARCE